MKRPVFLILTFGVLVAGCSTFSSLLRSKEHSRFESGIEALAAGDYAAAHEDLAWVAERFANQTDGQRAVVVLAVMELDPRNPARRTDVGTDLAATYLQLPDREAWVDPVARTIYLLGLELGAAEERAQRAERAAESPRQLPTLPGPSVTARLRSVEQERDRLAKRVTELETQVAAQEQEIQRIRRTIKP